MTRFTGFTDSMTGQIVELWNACFGEDFPMDERLWRQNVNDCLQTTCVRLAWEDTKPIGFVVGKIPGHICAIGVLPERRRDGVGTALLDHAEKSLVASGAEKILIGQDDRHFFPGVPNTLLPAQAFFVANGYQLAISETHDMWRELSDYSIPEKVQARIATLKEEGIELRSCADADAELLLAHLNANFSGRWVRDTQQRLMSESDPQEIKIAVKNGVVIGFAHTFTTQSVYIGPSIYWRRLLGPNYGGLGPIGVAADVRKIGLGLALLAYSVNEVKASGASRMAIDWTGLTGFYGKLGFVSWKRYFSGSRSAASIPASPDES